MNKAKALPKLMRKADEIWSAKVRRRDGKCMFCGNADPAKLSAHHWIVCKSGGNRSRWEEANGISLCFGCHIRLLHKRADWATVSRCVSALDMPIATVAALAAIYTGGWGDMKPSALFDLLTDYVQANSHILRK